MINHFIKKLFMSSAIQGSDIRDAKVDHSNNLIKFYFDGGSSFFMIVMILLIHLVVIIVMPMYSSGCSPYKPCKKRKEEKWKREILQMVEQRHRLDVEPVERGQLLGRGTTEV